eukprot:jgi/Picre1/30364/NNA_005728.t1
MRLRHHWSPRIGHGQIEYGRGAHLGEELGVLGGVIDDLKAEQDKLSMYHLDMRKLHQKIMQWKLARRNENQQRRILGEEPLPEDPPENEFKKPTEPSQLDTLLLANQMHSYASQISAVGAQSIEKCSCSNICRNKRVSICHNRRL